jgi:hypothetical protein
MRRRIPRLRQADGAKLGAAIFAAILGIAATWLLLVELVRPTLSGLPIDGSPAKAAVAPVGAAAMAAWIGLIRGSLWADYADTLAPNLSAASTGWDSPAMLAALNSARAAAVRAVELAPHESRAWLLIAAVDVFDSRRNVAGPLKMSYYTGPNELSLIPLRIATTMRSAAIAEPEVQVLAAGEIRTIITRKPDLKRFLIAAYRNALPEGRRFIEGQVNGLDPALLTSLRAANSGLQLEARADAIRHH